MSAATENVEHAERTRRSNYRYFFYAKHHGGDRKAAMWLPTVTREVEFSIFDIADFHEIYDSRGWLYGVLRDNDGELMEIGTWQEQVAEFPPGDAAEDPWHGYPQWSVDRLGPPNRRKQQCCPERAVFDKMLTASIINKIQRKRLLSGRTNA